MPEGVLKKVIKTKEEKQRDLQEVHLQFLFYIFCNMKRTKFKAVALDFRCTVQCCILLVCLSELWWGV